MKSTQMNDDLFTEDSTAEPSRENDQILAKAAASAALLSGAEGQAAEANGTDAFSQICEILGLNSSDPVSIISELKSRKAKKALLERLKRLNARKAYDSMLSQAKGLSARVKGFDLKNELSDRRFTALLRSGFSVEEAFAQVHFKQLMAAIMEREREKLLSNALEKLRTAALRPDENGAHGSAPAQSSKSVENLSGKSIRDILRRVENGAKIKF